LYWGGSSRAELYEDAAVRAWCLRYPNLRYTPVLSAPSLADAWDGRTGWVHRALLEDYPELASFDVYASGPPAMIAAIRQEFPAHGLPLDQLSFDSFDFAPDVLAKRTPTS
jgi:CDP-4-dehydro-6-deoxyglucose reductase